MSAHALLNLLNKLGKKRGLLSILSLFPNKFNKFNNTRAQHYILMKKVNKQCLLDTPRTVRVSEKTWQVIVQTRRP